MLDQEWWKRLSPGTRRRVLSMVAEYLFKESKDAEASCKNYAEGEPKAEMEAWATAAEDGYHYVNTEYRRELGEI